MLIFNYTIRMVKKVNQPAYNKISYSKKKCIIGLDHQPTRHDTYVINLKHGLRLRHKIYLQVIMSPSQSVPTLVSNIVPFKAELTL